MMRAPCETSSSAAKPRYHGNITIEMIDDFLNPISKKKEVVSKVKFAPSATTGGQGIIDFDSDKKNSNHSYLPFHQRDNNKSNFEYVSHNKRQYEKELRETQDSYSNLHLEASFLAETALMEKSDDQSIVGSAMSQIESVSTMNISNARKKELIKQVQKLNRINHSESGSMLGDENNNMKINHMIEQAKQIIEVDDKVKREAMLEQLCKTYQTKPRFDVNLPIQEKKHKLNMFIATYPFCIIQGSTGCGKTTQVPQYILDSHVENKKYCNIIVTQPRRIAAISVAKRVCSERSWRLGGICGYQIGLDHEHVSEDTRITYCTTGILLQKLIGPQAQENFEKYTHIILDEVHERDLETDFVLLIIKMHSFRNLKSKVILMSATMECELFRKYYALGESSLRDKDKKTQQNSRLRLVPMHIIETTPFKVQEFYWDDLVASNSFLEKTLTKTVRENIINYNKSNSNRNYYSYGRYNGDKKIHPHSIKSYKQHIQNLNFDSDEPEMTEETMDMVINLLKYFDTIEEQRSTEENDEDESDINTTVESCAATKQSTVRNRIIDGFAEIRDSVLIFVPGMQQIHQLTDLINRKLIDRKINTIPLHSDIVIEQQVRVFEKSNPCWRKVIIATSIAESSITVSDIKYVIDFGLTKELFCDPYTNYTSLRLEWASKSSMNQRKGRAGRVRDGICYRLITKRFYELLDDHKKPAILREPISSVILNVKRLNQTGEPKRILSLAIQPPKLSDIERTVLLLKEVGALTLSSKTSDGKYTNNPYNGDLTYVGSVMANLPIDVRLSKLILLGHAFGKLREAIIIAAGLSTKTIFTCYFKSYLESFKAKWTWSEGWMCDCICILNVFNLYETMNENGSLNCRKERLAWAKKNMIELDRLKEIETLKKEIELRLESFGIKCNRRVLLNFRRNNFARNSERSTYDIDDQNDSVRQNLIIKMIIAGAFYPNYFNANPIDLKQAEKSVSLKNIKNTVQIKGLPNNEGVLYRNKLTEIFRTCSNSTQLHFEDTKAYVEFRYQDEVTSKVNLSVYLAVQMRLLRLPMTLKRYNNRTTQKKLAQYEKLTKSSMPLNMIVAKNKSGIVKLNLSHQNQSELSGEDDDTITNKSFDDDEEHLNFIVAKDSDRFDMSKYLSYASILSRQENELKIVDNNSTFCDISTSLITESYRSRGNSSQLTSRLITNHITPDLNLITDTLSNPRYLLPEKVDDGDLIEICISEIIECGLFWAQINDSAHIETLSIIQATLNGPIDDTISRMDFGKVSKYELKLINPTNIKEGILCVTNYEEGDRQFYRAIVIYVNRDTEMCEIMFIDYGNREKKRFKEIFELSQELQEYPYQAFQCKIANIKPCIFKNPNGAWTKDSTTYFKKIINHTRTSTLRLKLIDLSDSNVAQCLLYSYDGDGNQKDIGMELVESEYAEKKSIESNSGLASNVYGGSSKILYIPSRKDSYSRTRPLMASEHNNLMKMKYKKVLNSTQTSNNDVSFATSLISLAEKNNEYDQYVVKENASHIEFDEIPDEDNCFEGEIVINGPYSPLEVNYYSIINAGHSKRTRIERNSINYTAIDDDPYNECTRLMIAAEVSLNASGEGLILRKTTLMPKFHGLSSICCMLFSPQVEFRTDNKKRRYTGALCGLGFDSHGPIYTDNDVESVFDVNIDILDITMINAVRLAINLIIGNEEAVSTWTNNDVNLRQLQERACLKLLQVIQRNREIIEPTYYEKPYAWNMIDEEDLITPMPLENKTEDKNEHDFYSYHQGIALNKEYE